MFETITSAVRGHLDNGLAQLLPMDVLCVAIALVLIALAKRGGMWIYALVALPGTFAHELAHYLVGVVLGARPSFPSLIPQRTERGWRLGAVSFRVGRLRALPIALAPLLLLPLALCWAVTFLRTPSWAWYALHVWIVAALLGASMPSRTDWRIAAPALVALLALAAAAVAAWWLLRG